MSAWGDLLFIVSSAFAIGAAVATVSLRNPLRSAVALLVHIIALAGIFLTLHAHLLAALQLLVYAGAVVVLFIFVIMILGPSAQTQRGDFQGLLVRTASVVGMAIVTAGVAFTLVKKTAPFVALPECPPGAGPECGQFGGVEGLGTVIYKDAMVPFELISVLLLVAVVGAVAVARGRSRKEAGQAGSRAEGQDSLARGTAGSAEASGGS